MNVVCLCWTNVPQSPLQEQPLLLEDLLEQEKREQEKQQQHQPPPASATPPLLSDVDFERLRADVLGTTTPAGGSPPQGIPGGPYICSVLHVLLLSLCNPFAVYFPYLLKCRFMVWQSSSFNMAAYYCVLSVIDHLQCKYSRCYTIL